MFFLFVYFWLLLRYLVECSQLLFSEIGYFWDLFQWNWVWTQVTFLDRSRWVRLKLKAAEVEEIFVFAASVLVSELPQTYFIFQTWQTLCFLLSELFSLFIPTLNSIYLSTSVLSRGRRPCPVPGPPVGSCCPQEAKESGAGRSEQVQGCSQQNQGDGVSKEQGSGT